MLLLIIVLILLFGGGGGYYGYSRWGSSGGLGVVGTVALILLILWIIGALGCGSKPITPFPPQAAAAPIAQSYNSRTGQQYPVVLIKAKSHRTARAKHTEDRDMLSGVDIMRILCNSKDGSLARCRPLGR